MPTIDYTATKLRALVILDAESKVDLLVGYGGKYSAKSQLYLDLGLSPNRVASMAPDVNESLSVYPGRKNLTNAALGGCKTVSDFIKKYCGAAQVKVPAGEPT